MAMLVRGHPTPRPQQVGTEDPELNIIIPQQEGQAVPTRGKGVGSYDTDEDYKQEGSDHDIEVVDEEEENSDTENT